MPRTPDLRQGKLLVAAGILTDPDGRVLLADRSRAKSMREFWEFPGGKRLTGETAESALRRELAEELGIAITSCEFFHRLEHAYPGMYVEIDFFLVSTWRGAPQGHEGQALQWLRPEEIPRDLLLPADAPILDLLEDT